jgi:Uma2 family endonuclease
VLRGTVEHRLWSAIPGLLHCNTEEYRVSMPVPSAFDFPLRADDLDRFPDDNLRYEIIDGQLHVSPAPAPLHQRAVTRLIVALTQQLPLGLEALAAPVDWRVSEHTQLQPDVLVVPQAFASGQAKLEVPPLLAVEVLSPSSRLYDPGTKLLAYEQAGLGFYWIVDPVAPAITVYRRTNARLEAVDHVEADTRLHVTDPFPLQLTPRSLVS